ncbi:MAG: c-type cytochrome [Planctomycetota bacterium]
MFFARLVAATVATIALVMVVFFATQPEARPPGEGGPMVMARASGPVPTKTLFAEHCARCHGEDGSGQGTTELERPARSFLDGGYTYGNTLQAVMRTLEHGIPGTPMPAFGESLTMQQRSSLARYVIDLGPPSTEVAPGEGVLEIGERPTVVHGMVVDREVAPEGEPRALVVGFPGGTSFLYRKTDATLLALRQGDFLERKDWRGRGGEPLRLLGATTWSHGTPGASRDDFARRSDGSALRASVRRSALAEDSVRLELDVRDDDGPRLGTAVERLAFVQVDGAPVATRIVFVKDGADAVTLRRPGFDGKTGSLRTASLSDGSLVASPEGRDDMLAYVHAQRWTPKLASAVAELVTSLE